MKKRKHRYPFFVYCGACRKCTKRKFKSLFDDRAMLNCADVNGLEVKTVIPFVLWRVSWCKLQKEEKKL